MQTFTVHICVFFYLHIWSCFQFIVHCFTDRVCHIHFERLFATIHSHFGLTEEEHIKHISGWFFIFFYSSDFGVCTWHFFQRTSFQQWWHHIAASFTDRLRQTDSLRCHCPPGRHVQNLYASFNPNKHLRSLCLRPALKWDHDVVCKWTTSQNWLQLLLFQKKKTHTYSKHTL